MERINEEVIVNAISKALAPVEQRMDMIIQRLDAISQTLQSQESQNTTSAQVYMTTQEAMKILGVSRKTLYNLAQKYLVIKSGGRYNRHFVPEEIAKLKQKRQLNLE